MSTKATTAKASGKTDAKKVEQALDKWWRERVQNSPASRDTVVHNHLLEAFGDLKNDLKAILEKSEVKDDAS